MDCSPSELDTLPSLQLPLLMVLPAELRLAIYDLVFIEDRPLLLNCACCQSYIEARRGQSLYVNVFKYHEDLRSWDTGELHLPVQPALTRTCRVLRSDALPVFYEQNTFRAHFCLKETEFDMAFGWLKAIGETNRRSLQRLELFAGDPFCDQDEWGTKGLLSASRKLESIEASIQDVSDAEACRHLVSFPEGGSNFYEGLAELFDSEA